MKRPRYVLFIITLLVTTGAIAAFKATRFNTFPFYTPTTSTKINGGNYGRLVSPAIPFCYFVATAFKAFRGNLTFFSPFYTTNGTTITPPITLKRINRTETIIIPAWTCDVIETPYVTMG